MKKFLTGTAMVAMIATAGVGTAMPQVAAAQTQSETVITLQQQVLNLLQQLIGLLTGGDDMMMDDGSYTLTIDSDLATLDLGHYEAWLIVGDDKIPSGTFTEGGNFTIITDVDPDTVDKIAITIEPEGDTDAIPSGIIVLVGDLNGDIASLSFPVDLSDVAGTAILATPSDGADNNETSGVWFLSVPGPEASLELPTLPDGWIYEGWAVHDGVPLTTGKFSSGDEADDFDGYSGPEATPDLPGEDFLENAPAGIDFPIDLADGASKVVISIEPYLDGVDPTGDGPAQVKPLLAEVAEGQADHTNITLGQHLESVPSGTATLK